MRGKRYALSDLGCTFRPLSGTLRLFPPLCITVRVGRFDHRHHFLLQQRRMDSDHAR